MTIILTLTKILKPTTSIELHGIKTYIYTRKRRYHYHEKCSETAIPKIT